MRQTLAQVHVTDPVPPHPRTTTDSLQAPGHRVLPAAVLHAGDAYGHTLTLDLTARHRKGTAAHQKGAAP